MTSSSAKTRSTGYPQALRIHEVSVAAGSHTILAPLSLTLYTGRALTILGETGSGKSLLAQAIMGNLPGGLAARGEVWLDGVDIMTLPTPKRRRLWGKRMTMLPQEPWLALDPLMQVGRQIRETWRHVRGRSMEEAARHTREDLARMGLSHAGDALPMTLSGGMAQRVAFAAARAGGAAIVIADEPTKGLDAERRDDAVTLLKKALDDGGALLTITHDIDVARKLGGDVMVIREGQVLESGPAETLLANPQSDYARALLAAAPSRWPRDSIHPRQTAPTVRPVLSARGIGKTRGGRTLFERMNIDIASGEIIGVTGASGSGKSSLGDVLLGLIAPDTGTLTRRKDIAGHRFQKLYQDPPAAFAPWWTLGQLLEDLIKLHGLDRDRVPGLLSRLALDPGLLDRRPASVSGGELQRFAILRALLLEPALLFADEPTSRLDPITQRDTLALLTRLAREHDCALLLVSHDADLIDRLCDRQLHLQKTQ